MLNKEYALAQPKRIGYRMSLLLLLSILCFGLVGCSKQEEEYNPKQVLENSNKQDIMYHDDEFSNDYSIIGGTQHPILWDAMESGITYWTNAPQEKVVIPLDEEKVTDQTILTMHSAFGGETINGININFSNSEELKNTSFKVACKLAQFYVPKKEGVEYKKSYSVKGEGWTKYISAYQKIDGERSFWFFIIITKNDKGKVESLEIVDGLPVELMDSQVETQEWKFNVYE